MDIIRGTPNGLAPEVESRHELSGSVAYLAVGASDVEVSIISRALAGGSLPPGSLGTGPIIRAPRPTAEEPDWSGLVRELDAAPDDLTVAPVRVSWLPPERGGRRTVHVTDIVTGNPRRPGSLRQSMLAKKPDRFQVIVGEPATVGALRERWDVVGSGQQSERSAFARFVVRRAVLAVERAEYRVFGAEYKVPRLVREQITLTARFRNLVSQLAQSTGRSTESVNEEADKYLNEMVAGSSRMFIDFTVQFAKVTYRQGYDPVIDTDPGQIEVLRSYTERYPALVLPSHRSNLDALVMPATLHEHHLPRTHTFGGINMAMWPIGPLFRNGGTIFIRRDANDNPVYKAMLREYVGYLMEKRFSLQWYVEGGRSRTGKMLPPKLGLLSYVVDAYRDGRTDDVALVPASIAYDQLHEVGEYAREAGGIPKKPENLAWFMNYWRSQRQPFGKIYVRFAEPLLLSQALGSSADVDALGQADLRLAMQKVGLEVARRINSVSPITGIALVTLVLLKGQQRAMTVEEIFADVRGPYDFVERRNLPMTASATDLTSLDGLQRTLDALVHHNVVRAYDGPETLYEIGADEHVQASFYRNTIIHFFVVPAIVELALAGALAQPNDAEMEATFFTTAARVRDLLKFDFFFEERDAFLQSVRHELDTESPDWRDLISHRDGVRQLIDSLTVLWSPVVLRFLLEAYWVVADALRQQENTGALDEKAFSKSLPNLARFALRRGTIGSPEAVSTHLFKPGLDLMRHLGLTAGALPQIRARREALTSELRNLIDLIDSVASLGAGR